MKNMKPVAADPRPARLGRGLSSLLTPSATATAPPAAPRADAMAEVKPEAPSTSSGLISVAVGELKPGAYQPRRHFDARGLEELAASLKTTGVMQPVIVREGGAGPGPRYEIVAGERRWRAASMAGLSHVPVLVRALSDVECAEWALVENIQREDLNAMDRAAAFKGLAERFNLTQEQIAAKVGLDRSTVANFMRLSELEPEIGELVGQGKLGVAHAKVLLGIPAEQRALRVTLAMSAVANQWSVRKLEQAAKDSGQRAEKPAASGEAASRAALVRDLEERLGRHLGTRVRVRTDRAGKRGRLEVEFYGLDHFDGLLERMGYRGA